jgi:hypothetical protein
MEIIIKNWVDEPYMNILLYQCEETRHIISKIDKLEEKNKCIVQHGIIGLLGKELIHKLLQIYNKEEFLLGIDNIGQHYPNYTNNCSFYLKKSWCKKKDLGRL